MNKNIFMLKVLAESKSFVSLLPASSPLSLYLGISLFSAFFFLSIALSFIDFFLPLTRSYFSTILSSLVLSHLFLNREEGKCDKN
jgi:hypothetical protein